MEKNWLIRTSRFQILGPVSREKIIELIKKGSLKINDEICSGNGYWFHIRDSDAMNSFLYDFETQNFNNISEAMDVLSGNKGQIRSNANVLEDTVIQDLKGLIKSPVLEQAPEYNEDIKLPGQNDLDFPLSGQNSNLVDDIKLPDNKDLAFPDIGNSGSLDVEKRKTQITQPVFTEEGDVIPAKDDLAFPEISSSKNIEDGKDMKSTEEEEVLLPNQSDLEFPSIEALSKDNQNEDSGAFVKINTGDHEEVTFGDNNLSSTGEKKENVRSNLKTSGTAILDLGGMKIGEDIKENLEVDEKPLKKHHEKIDRSERLKRQLEKGRKSLSEQEERIRENNTQFKLKKKRSIGVASKQKSDSYLFFFLTVLVVLLFAIGYYYWKILEKPLPTFVSNIFIEKAYSQEIDNSQYNNLKKKRFLKYQPLKTKYSFIYFDIDLWGWRFYKIENVKFEKCIKPEDSFDFSLTILFLYKSKKIAQYEKCIKEFLRNNDDDFVETISKLMVQKSTFDKEAIYEIAMKNIKSQNLKKIIKKYKGKKINERHNKVINLYKDIFLYNKKQDVNTQKTILSQEGKPLKVNLLLAALALKFGNQGASNRIVKEIIQTDPEKELFVSYEFLMSLENEKESYYNYIFSILKYIEKNLRDRELVKLFISYIRYLTGISINGAVYDYSSAELLKILSSPVKGWLYFGHLFQLLNEKMSQREVTDIFNRILSPFDNSNFSSYRLDGVQRMYSIKKNIRSLINKDLQTDLNNLNTDYGKYLLLKLARNEILKKELVERNKWLKKANFQYERMFFKSLINNNKGISFSMYNLIKLGDKNNDFLWWFLL